LLVNGNSLPAGVLIFLHLRNAG